mmetsp:Transcript_68643/g.188258  ORF Transcript_68643/g.188258 Transcript_68643/m.188258 type:complete len:236 (-) Transcript_68643:1113-1820(-)
MHLVALVAILVVFCRKLPLPIGGRRAGAAARAAGGPLEVPSLALDDGALDLAEPRALQHRQLLPKNGRLRLRRLRAQLAQPRDAQCHRQHHQQAEGHIDRGARRDGQIGRGRRGATVLQCTARRAEACGRLRAAIPPLVGRAQRRGGLGRPPQLRSPEGGSRAVGPQRGGGGAADTPPEGSNRVGGAPDVGEHLDQLGRERRVALVQHSERILQTSRAAHKLGARRLARRQARLP